MCPSLRAIFLRLRPTVRLEPMRPTPPPEPIVAIATAPGRGAVGIVRVSGADLCAFIPALLDETPAPRRAHLGAFRDARGEAIDEGLALHFPAPHSYTGESVLELQAHGGPVVLQLLLARCLQAAAEPRPDGAGPRLPGLRLARPGEFTERAFLNGKLDLAQAEAVADLIDAGTEQAARSATRSLQGAFSSAVQALREGLETLRVLVEATLDFPEEDIDFIREADCAGRVDGLRGELAALLAQARQGALLRDGLRVVLAGQPNVGKSSLLNALAGAELAIVTPVPGTTRDRLRETIAVHGMPLHITDTAGLRDTDDTVERLGVARSWEAAADADLLLLVHDAGRRGEPDYATADARIEAELAERCPHARWLHVDNKSDLVEPGEGEPPAPTPEGMPAAEAEAQAGPVAPRVAVSARTGAGLERLRAALAEAAGAQPGTEGVFIARERHLVALREALAHLDTAAERLQQPAPALDLLAEDLRLAHRALGSITGQFDTEELLGAIFGRFCIGK